MQQLSPELKQKLRRSAVPGRVDAQLATLSHEPFSGSGWLFERKLDGERCIAIRDHGEARLRSRNHKSLDVTYPEIVESLQEGPDLVLDGEVVAFEGAVTSFSRLQQRMQVQSLDQAR